MSLQRDKNALDARLKEKEQELAKLEGAVSRFEEKERALRRFQELGAWITFNYQWAANGGWIPNAKNPGNPLLQPGRPAAKDKLKNHNGIL